MSGDELRIYLKKEGYEQKDIARLLDISPQNLNRKLLAQQLKLSFLEDVARVINKSVYDITGSDDFLKLEEPQSLIKKTVSIPLIPIDAMAGVGTGEISILNMDCDRYVIPVFRSADYLIQIAGSSMVPKYNSGDIVACKRLSLKDVFFQWNKVYVIDSDQGALIKRVHPGKDEYHIKLVSENNSYMPFEIDIRKINAIALVIGVIRLE